jgi:ankyrin repeat protein
MKPRRFKGSIQFVKSEENMNPIHEMIERMSYSEEVQRMIQAVVEGKFELVKEYISSGIDINAPGNRGWTALRIGACVGDYPMVKLLLDNGAAVDACNLSGHTALMMAATYDFLPIVKLFLEYGADPNATNLNNSTA